VQSPKLVLYSIVLQFILLLFARARSKDQLNQHGFSSTPIWEVRDLFLAFALFNSIALVLSVLSLASVPVRALLVRNPFVAPYFLLCLVMALHKRKYHQGLQFLGLQNHIGAMILFTSITAVSVCLAALSANGTAGVNQSDGRVSDHFAGFFGICLIAPLAEESFIRTIVYDACRRLLGVAWGILFSAGYFAVIHPNGLSPSSVVAHVFVGALFGIVYQKTGSLLLTAGAHSFVNSLVYFLAIRSFV
jgi:membrane protease YdiL (CAAX protease family)